MAVAIGKNPKDIIAGALMIVFGLFVAIWAQQHYTVGEAARMGPGWFPTFLGYLLAIIGVIIMLPGFFREGGLPPIQWRPMIALTVSVATFAATVKWIGLAPAIFLQIGISAMGDTKLGIKGILILSTLTAIACHLVFYVGLEVQLPPFVWPFQ